MVRSPSTAVLRFASFSGDRSRYGRALLARPRTGGLTEELAVSGPEGWTCDLRDLKTAKLRVYFSAAGLNGHGARGGFVGYSQDCDARHC